MQNSTTTVHTNPTQAWEYLCQHGGLELSGRDEGLDKGIHDHLNPFEPSFAKVLLDSSLESFLKAFFNVVHPYILIFEGIIEFFKQSSANKGQDQWKLQVGDIGLDLDQFREQVAKWSQIHKSAIDVRAIDRDCAWDIYHILGSYNLIGAELGKADKEQDLNLPRDVQEWVKEYNQGEKYKKLPKSLNENTIPNELHEITRILRFAVGMVAEQNINRDQLKKLFLNKINTSIVADWNQEILDLWSIAHHDIDFWLRSMVVGISAAATLLSPYELEDIGHKLKAKMDVFPLKPHQITVTISDFDSLLSLPIWSQRYELYSVWIATEVIRALKGHKIKIHHDNGRIAFSFKETLIATINSSPGPFRLISEKRSPILNPSGERKNAQPDHALWSTEFSTDACRMVIEVKHYKRSAKKSFVEVFEDYAKAHPEADIYLVNHGPTGKAVDSVSFSIKNRCYAIPNLTPMNPQARHELAKAVRKCVGEPIINWEDEPEMTENNGVLLIDVSGSMKPILRSLDTHKAIKEVIEYKQLSEIVAVDEKIVGRFPPTKAGFLSLIECGGKGTRFDEVVAKYQKDGHDITVITDTGGEGLIYTYGVREHPLQRLVPRNLRIYIIDKLTA